VGAKAPNNFMPMPATCSRCGATLTGFATEGFCSACMLEAGLGSADHSAGPEVVAARQTFGDFELLEEIARGGMGVVFKARQINLNRLVALKMILRGEFATPAELTRFRAEAETSAQLQHPNIVAIHEVGERAGQPFFCMDLVEGRNLAEVVANTPLAPLRAANYLKTVAAAVHYAHTRGVLHRDLKPSNVLIDADDQPRVTDFGLAKKLEGGASLTHTGQVLGSPNFMPPEQAAGKSADTSPSSDVYSLGAMLYHMLTGRPPFVAENLAATLRLVAESEPVAPRSLAPGVPPDLEAICLKCLEKEPRRRYATARELADELGRFLRDEPVRARHAGRMEKFWRWSRRHPALAYVSAVAVLLLFAVAIISTVAAARFQRANQEGQEKLREAYLAQAHASRVSGLSGGRVGSLEAIRKAAEIRPSVEVRSAAISSLALLDLIPAGELSFTNGLVFPSLDPTLRKFARIDPNGEITVRTLNEETVLQTIPGRNGKNIASRFSPNGLFLAITSEQGTQSWTRIHDLERNITRFEAARPKIEWAAFLDSLVFSPDSRFLAWQDQQPDGRYAISILNVAQDTLAGTIVRRRRPQAMAFDHSHQRLAVASGGSARVEILEVPSGRVSASLEMTMSSGLWSLAWGPEDESLVCVGQDGRVYLWDLMNTNRPPTLICPQADAMDARFNSGRNLLLTISGDVTHRFWNPQTSQELLRRHAAPLDGLTRAWFSPDDRRVALCDHDRYLVFDLAGAREWRAFRASSAQLRNYSRVAWSSDGSLLVTSQPGPNLWDVSSGQVRAKLRSRAGGIRASFFGSRDGALITVWNNEVERRVISTRDSDSDNELLLNPPVDLKLGSKFRDAAIDHSRNTLLLLGSNKVHVVDIAAWRQRNEFNHDGEYHGIALSPDGRWCAAWERRGSNVTVWETDTARVVRKLPATDVSVAQFAPGADLLVTGSTSEYIAWRIQTGTQDYRFAREKAQGARPGLAFTADGFLGASIFFRTGHPAV